MSYLPVSTSRFTASWRRGREPHEHVIIRCGDHRIEVTVSPNGRKWHVWIDNEKVK